MGIKYIIDNSDGSLPQQVINGSLSATTFYGDGSGLSGVTATPSYKVYTALLTQTGTTAPVATVLENTLGGDIIWSRNGTGDYTGLLTGAFTSNKTAILLGNVRYTLSSVTLIPADITVFSYSVNDVSIGTMDNSSLVDDILFNTFVEIRVYN